MSIGIEGLLYLGFLVVTLTLAWMAGNRVRSVADFHVASKAMTWPVLVGSFVASNASIGFFLGSTTMAGEIGYAFWCAYVASAISLPFAVGVLGVLARRLAEYHPIYSFGDLLSARYASMPGLVRTVAGVLVGVIYLPYMAAQFTGLAAITSSLTSLPYEAVLVGSVTFVVAFTLRGGMIGVIWTDTFMVLVLLLGIVLAVPAAIIHLGGDPSMVWQRVIDELPPVIFQGVHPEWPLVAVAGQFVWIFGLSSQPHLLTRFLAAKDERAVMKAMPVCVVLTMILYASSIPAGLLGRFVGSGSPANSYYYLDLAKVLGPWIGGFALAGIAAAGLSTCSTQLIITSQTLSRDLYHEYLRPRAAESEIILVSRGCVVFVGMVTLLIAFYQNIGVFWLVFLSVSLLISAFFIPVVLGLLWNGGSALAAVSAMITGPIFAVLTFFINQRLQLQLSGLEAYAGVATSAIAYFLVSRFHSPSESEFKTAAQLSSFKPGNS